MRAVAPAEGARRVDPALLQRALAGGEIHDLVDALVADPKRIGDLPQRRAGRMQAPDRMLVADLCELALVLELDERSRSPRAVASRSRSTGIRLPR
jgi:hypothetical protein